MHKKGLKFALVVELYHSTKIAKPWPGFDDRLEYPSIQINSSSPWLASVQIQLIQNLPHFKFASFYILLILNPHLNFLYNFSVLFISQKVNTKQL